MMKLMSIFFIFCFLSACSSKDEKRADIRESKLDNAYAYIPPQCYSDLKRPPASQGNSCYTCHTGSTAPNYLQDGDLQLSYGFPESALTNPWGNSFKDRSEDIANIKDDLILDYVRKDNYKNPAGDIDLATVLNDVPREWDVNGNGQWDGYKPDVNFKFDDEGFDFDDLGAYTGWRVYAYYPLPGAFMPTNGSTGDVLIRLPKLFRLDSNNNFDKDIYMANLAVVEAYIKRQDVHFSVMGEDQKMVYKWDSNNINKRTEFWGLAGQEQKKGSVKIAPGLYPVGTEFAHSVRYLDVQGSDTVMSARMKELRYARKNYWTSYGTFQDKALGEIKERHDFPSRLKQVIGNAEEGVSNRLGWTYQGFIENKNGRLRPQSYEELVFCIGCHSGVGVNQDNIFSLQRKLNSDQFKQGWYHWLEKGMQGIPERIRKDGENEYAYYLTQNKAGDDFAANDEVHARFFIEGEIKKSSLDLLQDDISYLLMPSAKRALTLNKAYKIIVQEQSYSKGRDAVLHPVQAHKRVELDQETGVKQVLSAH